MEDAPAVRPEGYALMSSPSRTMRCAGAKRITRYASSIKRNQSHHRRSERMPKPVDVDPNSLMKVDQLTEEEVEKLKCELHSSHRDRRSAAFELLHQLLKDRAIFGLSPSELSSELQNADVETRKQASWAIGKMAQNKLPGDYSLDLMELLTSDPDPEVKENAAWAIGEIAGVQIGRERSIAFLNLLLADESFEVKGMAAWGIGRLADKLFLGNTSSLTPLVKMAEDQSEFVRKSARFALERLAKIGIIPRP
jgi:HEAT repeat protein